jgi:hypothetical protein
MGRVYRVTFPGTLVAAPQDLIFLPGAAGKMIRILHRWVGATDTSLVNAQSLELRERILPATVTAGSGGVTGITPSKTDLGDATCSISTAGTNNTTKATTTGTANILWADGTHIWNGYDDDIDAPYPVGPGEAYVFELISTVSGTVHLAGGVEIEEIGG